MLVVDDRNGTLVVQPGWARFRLWPQVGAARRQRRHVGRDLGDPSRPIRRVLNAPAKGGDQPGTSGNVECNSERIGEVLHTVL